MKIMNMLEFHTKIANITKILKFHSIIMKNNENPIIPYENHETHENHKITRESLKL